MALSASLDPQITNGLLDPAMQDAEILDAAPVDIEQLEKSLNMYLTNGHQKAVMLHQPRKLLWWEYRQMQYGKGVYSDWSDPLVQMGVHLPLIAKLINIFKANSLREAIPDPSDMDFFEFDSKREGLEEYAKIAQHGLRDKFKGARPLDAAGFYDLNSMWLDDLYAIGNCMAITTHEVTAADWDGNTVLSGPTPQYVNPVNAWPWDYDVNLIDRTNTTLYAPITKDDLVNSNFPPDLVAKVLEGAGPDALRRVDEDARAYIAQDGALGWWGENTAVETDLYRRYIYCGRFPGIELRDRYQIPEEVTDDMMFAVLSERFGWDLDKANSHWWLMSWVGEVLLECRPWPLPRAYNGCPIRHLKLNQRNQFLWGLGLYDYGAWDERLYNFYHRRCVMTTSNATNPPFWWRKDIIDATWLLEQGSEQPNMVPGVGAPINQDPGTQAPIVPFLYNIESVSIGREQMAFHQSSLKELTGGTSAVEGTSDSATATQDQNNLQQSLKLIDLYNSLYSNSFLKQIVADCYVIYQYAMSMEGAGFFENVPVDMDEMGMKSVQITFAHLIDLDLIDIRMTGGSAPGNRMNQAAAFDQFVKTWMGAIDPMTGMPILDMREAAKQQARMLGIAGANRLINDDPMIAGIGMQRGAMNRQLAFGPMGPQSFQSDKEKAMQMGQGMPGQQAQPQSAGGAGAPRNPAPSPVPAGNGGFVGR